MTSRTDQRSSEWPDHHADEVRRGFQRYMAEHPGGAQPKRYRNPELEPARGCFHGLLLGAALVGTLAILFIGGCRAAEAAQTPGWYGPQSKAGVAALHFWDRTAGADNSLCRTWRVEFYSKKATSELGFVKHDRYGVLNHETGQFDWTNSPPDCVVHVNTRTTFDLSRRDRCRFLTHERGHQVLPPRWNEANEADSEHSTDRRNIMFNTMADGTQATPECDALASRFERRWHYHFGEAW